MIITESAEKPKSINTPFKRFYSSILEETKNKNLNELISIMLAELSTVGAKTLEYDILTNQWVIDWDDDMYTFFIMKWS